MKKFRKIISAISALAMSISILPMAVMAENSSETIMYENDFSASTIQEALAAYANDYLSFSGYTPVTAEDGTVSYTNGIEGNSPALSNGALTQAKERGPNGRTLLFDFTKGGTKDGISGGIIRISYDVALRGGSLDDSYSQTYTGINMADYSDGGRMHYFDATGWDTKDVIGGWPTTPTHFVDTDVHTYETIFNYNAQKAYLYVDGELEHTWTNLYGSYASLNNWAMAMNGDIKSLDNLKISMLNDASAYSFSAAEQGYATGYVDLVFPAAMDVTKGIFTVDGTEATSVDWLNLNTARVYADSLYNGGTHTITVSGAADLYGVAPSNSEASVATEVLLPEEVLYYNTFDDGAASVDWETWQDFGEFEGLKIQKVDGKSVNSPVTATFDGNKGIRGSAGSWPRATQICFDFTKSGTQSAISTGTYKFSWDFSLGGNTDGCDKNFIGLNMPTTYEGQMLIQYQGSSLYLLEGGKWSTGLQELDADKVHSIDIIIDFDADLVYFYINGELKYTRDYFSPTMSTFDINMCQCMDFFDNLKVSRMNKGMGYTYAATTDSTAANGYVDLTFPAWMDVTAGEFAVDAETAASVKWLSASKVRVYADALKNAGEHTINFANVADKYGVAPINSSVTVNLVYPDGEVVIYENDFNNGAADITYDEYETYNAGVRTEGMVNVLYPKADGNPGLACGRTSDDGRTVLVDFTKTLAYPGEGGAGISSGKVKVSFDFVMKAIAEGEFENTATVGVKMSNFYNGNIFADFGTATLEDGTVTGRVYTRPDANSYCKDDESLVTEYISLGQLHTFDMILDLDTGYTVATYYLDGEKLDTSTKYWQNNVPNIALCFNTFFKYIDNVKVSYMKAGTFEVEGAAAPVAGQEYIDIYTTELPGAITADMVTINGTAAASVSVLTNPGAYENNARYVIRATLAEAVKAGEAYEIKVADTATNVLGTAIDSENASATVETLGKTSLTVESGTVNAVIVNTDDVPVKPVLMVAEYAGDGRLIGVSSYNEYTVAGESVSQINGYETAEITVDVSDLSGNVKAFLVNSFTRLTPLV